jgi:hypothetical protein
MKNVQHLRPNKLLAAATRISANAPENISKIVKKPQQKNKKK